MKGNFMKLSIYRFLVLCTCLFSTGLYAQETLMDTSTQAAFPRDVSFESQGKQYQLQATGVATRKKLVFKVYSVAHYLQKGADKPKGDKIQEIMSDDNAKQLTLKWMRDVDPEKVQEGFQESFHKAFSGQESAQLKNEINHFVQFFNQGAHKGDEFVLRWLPGGYIEVLINDHKIGSISNKEFAQRLWSLWFGDHSVVNRDDLISQMK
jgi:hypothetical protein